MTRTPAVVAAHSYQLIVQRPDGAGFATTSSDRKQNSGSLTLEPDIDLRPRELALNDQLFGSAFDLEGGFGAAALSIADLESARWSGSSVQLRLGDWSNDAEPCVLAEGELGQALVEDGRVTMSIDLRPVAARQVPCLSTSPECRAILGDQQCRVDMRSRKLRVEVVAIAADGIIVEGSDLSRFGMGRLRWITGSQCGTEDLIITVDVGRLVLRDFATSAVKIGDSALLFEGCDGRRASCSERFANIMNFRGEPDLPGSEILLRFPGA